MHEPASRSSLYVPAAHSVELLEPVGLKDPGVVLAQSAALDKSVLSLWLPASHGNGADAPRGQYEPLTHGLQPVEPEAS